MVDNKNNRDINFTIENILRQIKDLRKIYNKKNNQSVNEKLSKTENEKFFSEDVKVNVNEHNTIEKNHNKDQKPLTKNKNVHNKGEKIFDYLEEQINILVLENSRLRADKLKALADLENSKRMMNQEIIDTKKFGLTKFVNDLLPVLDNFERAVSVSNESKEVKNFLLGFQMIYKNIKQIFQKDGIEEIIVKVGDAYNSHIHNAVEVIESKDARPNTIIKILQKGYKIKDRVLRPTSVTVAKEKVKKEKQN